MDLIWTVFISWRGMISGQWSDIFLMMTNLIALTSVFDSALWLREHPHVHAHRYYVWWALFWAALIGLAISQNLALSWLAVEFSTLTSGALIIETGEPHALEAAWKYIVIASVGLLLGLIGVVFLYASLRTPGSGWNTLNYSYLALHSHAIAPVVGQLVSIFLVVGFGTKAGLVPFHTWLPDAHSEAPSPVSGLLSGVLLGLSLFTLVRVVPYLPKPPHAFLTGDHLLTLFGCLSVAVGSLALLVQQDIKRLLAYSSVEQVGLMALAAALNTPASLHAALWQFALHAVIKSSLFYGAGHLSVKYGTKALKQIRGLQAQHRFAATAWAVGILALAGVPPFGLAYSEWLILGQLWIHHSYFIIVITASALTLTFASLTYHLLHTLWEPPEPSAGTHRELSFWEETAL
jgi:hydrogenase-4 component F